MKGSIREGAIVSQDFHYGLEITHREEAPLIMDIKNSGKFYICTGEGFGKHGNYGNGALLVENLEDLTIIEM